MVQWLTVGGEEGLTSWTALLLCDVGPALDVHAAVGGVGVVAGGPVVLLADL